MSIALERVIYVPERLTPGILYVSEKYGVAAHLCACGCGNKVIVPLGPTEWSFTEHNGLPSLYPSLGNWQLPCRSHYFVTDGEIEWAGSWSAEKIEMERFAEERRRKAYFESKDNRGFKANIASLFSRFFK